MACFVAPLIEAAAVSVIKATVKNQAVKRSLGSLEKMLYGGSAMFIIEHLYHGETDLISAAAWHEILTVGVLMSAGVTAVWAIAVLVGKFRRSCIL